MKRIVAEATESVGHDSFLDVVANMVGILIILVMIVGVRAGSAPTDAAVVTDPEAAAAVDALQKQADRMKQEARETGRQSEILAQEIRRRGRQREELATVLAAVKEDLDQRQSALGAVQQRQFSEARELAAARHRLAELKASRTLVNTEPPQTVTIQNLPTPLSRTVHGDEVHFQLQGKRLAYIPLEELLKAFQADARQQVRQLGARSSFTDTVGPIGGFRLRYQLGRYQLSTEEQLDTGYAGSIVRLIGWELLPIPNLFGESLEVALGEDSELRSQLRRRHPGRTTITVWTYPDSFAEFRRLKAELHAQGYRVASRPLPAGQQIAGSPDGSRSAAQ